MKIIALLLPAALLAGTILMSGCQTAGQVVSSKPLATCPQCMEQVVTSSIKGDDFTRVVCSCPQVWVSHASPYSHERLAYYCPDCREVISPYPEGEALAMPRVWMLNQLLY
jgi:Zn finger protein HypA/HybF involved in hydrogenase expression